MAQLLLIDHEPHLSKVIKLNLMKTYDLNVIEKESISEALDLLEMLPDIALIIIRDVFNFKSKISDLTQYLKDNNSKVHLLCHGKEKIDYEKITFVEAKDSWQPFVELAGKILGFNPLGDFSASKNEFVPVPLSYFYNIHETSFGCDVYIRVKKNENDYAYIKRLNSTDYFERKDIEKYKNAGLKEFHISKEHFPAFVNYVTDQLTLQLSDKKLQGTERMQLSADIFEITAERIATLGVDERTMEIVNESVKSMQTSVGSGNALSDFLKMMMQNKLSYNYAHSFLICLLLSKIIKQFDWDSASVREKITFMAYFHDIALRDPDHAKFQSMEDLDKSDLSAEQKIQIQQHAFKSAQIVEQFTQIPIGVGALIREHHGVKSGVGFASSPGIAVSPLSMIFVVVEHFACEFLKIEGTPTKTQLDDILKNMEAYFSKGTYLQTVQALQKVIGK